jgi:cytochrome P450
MLNPSQSRPPTHLVTKLIFLHHNNPLFTSRHLTDMTLSNFGAGTETIGITLLAVLCNIMQRPTLQAELQKEIDDTLKEGRLTCSREGLVKIGHGPKELKLLEATLRESMRLNPVVGVPFPRAVGEEGILIDGIFVPGGVSHTIPSNRTFPTHIYF